MKWWFKEGISGEEKDAILRHAKYGKANYDDPEILKKVIGENIEEPDKLQALFDSPTKFLFQINELLPKLKDEFEQLAPKLREKEETYNKVKGEWDNPTSHYAFVEYENLKNQAADLRTMIAKLEDFRDKLESGEPKIEN